MLNQVLQKGSGLPFSIRQQPALDSEKLRLFFDTLAPERDRWRRKNRYYYRELERYCQFVIPKGASVLEIGCGTGDLLAAVKPSRGVGIDISDGMLKIARQKYPDLEFRTGSGDKIELDETFDYVILSDLVGFLHDIQRVFEELQKVVRPDSRIVITYYNYFWEPLLKVGEALHLKVKLPTQNWLPLEDIENLLYLSGFEVVRKGYRFLLPRYIPILSVLLNRFVAKFPFIRTFCMTEVLVARPTAMFRVRSDITCSVIVPCRNERGNIEGAVTRTPNMGVHTEIIFVDGNSADGTPEEIERCIAAYPGRDIRLIHQGEGIGKGDAVRKGFATAKGDVLMILDADLTVPPEELPKFFDALIEGKGEFINGTRLVYPMERQAMRFLNLLANKFFSMVFTFLLEQRIRDTLCGTKVLFKIDYEKIVANRIFFGDFDPFGDFDLLFGASKLNLKIVEVPIRYRDRTYGTTQISRFKHGWLLLKMTFFGIKKIKFV